MNPSAHTFPRTQSSWKPRIAPDEVPFFCCSQCGTVSMGVSGNKNAYYSDTGRAPLIILPFMKELPAPYCCGYPMKRLTPLPVESISPAIEITYQISGGSTHNLVTLRWNASSTNFFPLWAALKSFTGVQIKYALPGQKNSCSFALSDEDAYAYCTKDPCIECRFRCKSGCMGYLYEPTLGLAAIPLNAS